MTQRIFDVENEKDMADLWDILSDKVIKVVKQAYGLSLKYYGNNDDVISITDIIQINWHYKTEITRPIQEAIEQDVGKLCIFWNEDNVESYGILTNIRTHVTNNTIIAYVKNGYDQFEHCRRLTKQEIEELC